MNGNKDIFARLLLRARLDRPACVDVSDSVLSELAGRGAGGQPLFYQPLVWIAWFSGAAAACVLLLAYFYQQASSDIAGELFNAVSWVTL